MLDVEARSSSSAEEGRSLDLSHKSNLASLSLSLAGKGTADFTVFNLRFGVEAIKTIFMKIINMDPLLPTGPAGAEEALLVRHSCLRVEERKTE